MFEINKEELEEAVSWADSTTNNIKDLDLNQMSEPKDEIYLSFILENSFGYDAGKTLDSLECPISLNGEYLEGQLNLQLAKENYLFSSLDQVKEYIKKNKLIRYQLYFIVKVKPRIKYEYCDVEPPVRRLGEPFVIYKPATTPQEEYDNSFEIFWLKDIEYNDPFPLENGWYAINDKDELVGPHNELTIFDKLHYTDEE